jgi:hypothetical protein
MFSNYKQQQLKVVNTPKHPFKSIYEFKIPKKNLQKNPCLKIGFHGCANKLVDLHMIMGNKEPQE